MRKQLTRAQKRQITINLFLRNNLRFIKRHIVNKEIHLEQLSRRKNITIERLTEIAKSKEIRLGL